MKKKTAIFRCDGGPNIGNGHILRDLILAEHLKKKNVRIIFLIRQCSLFLKNLIKSNFRIITLKKDYMDSTATTLLLIITIFHLV